MIFVSQHGVRVDSYQVVLALISPPLPTDASYATCSHSWLEIEKATVITKSFN